MIEPTAIERDLPAEIKVLADEIAMLWAVVQVLATPAQMNAIRRMRARMIDDVLILDRPID